MTTDVNAAPPSDDQADAQSTGAAPVEANGAAPDATGAALEATHLDAADLSAAASQLIRSLPRPPRQAAVAGFLANTRAHPRLSAAEEYAARKRALAEQTEQRVEQQFWSRVGQLLRTLAPEAPEDDEDRRAGLRAQALARHLAAEALLRLSAVEESHRVPPRGRTDSGRAPGRPSGG